MCTYHTNRLRVKGHVYVESAGCMTRSHLFYSRPNLSACSITTYSSSTTSSQLVDSWYPPRKTVGWRSEFDDLKVQITTYTIKMSPCQFSRRLSVRIGRWKLITGFELDLLQELSLRTNYYEFQQTNTCWLLLVSRGCPSVDLSTSTRALNLTRSYILLIFLLSTSTTRLVVSCLISTMDKTCTQ